MAISEEQLAKERKAEAAFNAISERVIGLFPWGQFYPLMKAGADLGEGMIPRRVCTYKGRIVEVATSKAGKWAQSFIRPAHEHAGKAFSQGDFWRGVVGLSGHGWIYNIKEQQNAKCSEITPNEFLSVYHKTAQGKLRQAQETLITEMGVLTIVVLVILAVIVWRIS